MLVVRDTGPHARLQTLAPAGWRVLWGRTARQWAALAAAATVLAILVAGGLWCRCRCRRARAQRKRRSVRARSPPSHYPGAASPRDPRRYPGIANVGNSCYLNSVLQALAAVQAQLQIEQLARTRCVLELWSVLAALNAPCSAHPLSAAALISAMGGSLSSEQQDAHEMLQAILALLSNHRTRLRANLHSLSQPRASARSLASPANVYPQPAAGMAHADLAPWEGMLVTSVRCLACGSTSRSTQGAVFSVLTLPAEDTLEHALCRFLAPEIIADYHCQGGGCGGGGKRGCCAKTTCVARWPEVLLIHIQRIAVALGVLHKDDRPVSFPLSMADWPQGVRAAAPSQPSPLYDLAAVVEHHGAISSGHYTAFRRVLDGAGGARWLYCSDATVADVGLGGLCAARPYLLVYARRQTDAAH